MSPAEKNSRPRAGPVRAALPIEHRERRQISRYRDDNRQLLRQLPVVQRYSPPAPGVSTPLQGACTDRRHLLGNCATQGASGGPARQRGNCPFLPATAHAAKGRAVSYHVPYRRSLLAALTAEFKRLALLIEATGQREALTHVLRTMSIPARGHNRKRHRERKPCR